jgi:hypothetical protein
MTMNPKELPPADGAGTMGTIIGIAVGIAILFGLVWYADHDPGLRVAEGPAMTESVFDRLAPATTGQRVAPETPAR